MPFANPQFHVFVLPQTFWTVERLHKFQNNKKIVFCTIFGVIFVSGNPKNRQRSRSFTTSFCLLPNDT